jgi:hypothetical protein
MPALNGLPDLAAPLASTSGRVFRAYGVTGGAVAVPDRLGLERRPDGSPVLLLTVLRGPTGTAGRLEMGVTVDADLTGIGRDLLAVGESLRLTAVDPEDGVLEATSPLGASTTHLGADLLQLARFEVPLSGEGAALMASVLQGGSSGVGVPSVAMRLSVRAVAPRLPLAATVDPHHVMQRLVARFGPEALVDAADLAAALDALWTDPATTVDGDADAVDVRVRGEALALRMRDRLTVPAPTAALRHRLRPLADVPSGPERVDLAVPTAVPVHLPLALDGDAARRAVAGVDRTRLIRNVDLPVPPAGQVRPVVAANLPEPIAGLRVLAADVEAPATPLRPQPAEASGVLAPPERTAELVLTVAPDEPLAGRARLRAVLDTADGPAELHGPWQEVPVGDAAAGGSRILLGPSAFPLPLTVVRASPALVALAVVEVRTARDRTLVRLDDSVPAIAVARSPADEPLRLSLLPRAEGRPLDLPLPERPRVDLDPATLPGFGVQHARFVGGVGEVVVEILPDGADERFAQSVRVGPDRATVDVTWVATSPFQPGLRWRVSEPGAARSWSEPVLPSEGLEIVLDTPPVDDGHDAEGVEVDGVELWPDGAEAGAWAYLPPGPLLDHNPDGSAAIGLIEAGSVAFLQLTARIDVGEGERDQLLNGLRALRPAAASLHPAPIAVQGVHLEVAAGDTWSAVATSTSSGLPPWVCAIATTVTEQQLESVRAALGGTRGRLRLRAQLTVKAAPVVLHSSERSDDLSVTTGDTRVEMRTRTSAAVNRPGRPERAVERMADIADLLYPT